jgi:hypothetical protein
MLSILLTKFNVVFFNMCTQDALKAVSKSAVREARLKEIKAEVLNSEKLKVRIPIYNADEVCMLVVILPPNLFLHLVFISVGSLCLM